MELNDEYGAYIYICKSYTLIYYIITPVRTAAYVANYCKTRYDLDAAAGDAAHINAVNVQFSEDHLEFWETQMWTDFPARCWDVLHESYLLFDLRIERSFSHVSAAVRDCNTSEESSEGRKLEQRSLSSSLFAVEIAFTLAPVPASVSQKRRQSRA